MVKGYSPYYVKSDWLHYIFVCYTWECKPVIVSDVSVRFNSIIKKVLKDLKCEWRDIDIQKDHVYLGVKAHPCLSPHKIISRIKGVSSGLLRKDFPELKKIPSLWTRKYFVSTFGKIDNKAIEQFGKSVKRIANRKCVKKRI